MATADPVAAIAKEKAVARANLQKVVALQREKRALQEELRRMMRTLRACSS